MINSGLSLSFCLNSLSFCVNSLSLEQGAGEPGGARCHVCWCLQTCNVYMDSTIIFYFLFWKHIVFNQGDKSWAFLFSLAPFLFSLARWTAWVVRSIAWGGRRTNQVNCRTKTFCSLPCMLVHANMQFVYG